MAITSTSMRLRQWLLLGAFLGKATVNAQAQAAAPVVKVVEAPVPGATAVAGASSAAPGAAACPAIPKLVSGTVLERKDYSFQRRIDICIGSCGNSSLGYITSPVDSITQKNELHTTTGSLVAYLENPAVFWDTTADMYDCVNNVFAQIQWSTDNLWMNMFNPTVKRYQIFDGEAKEVATMEKIKHEAAVASSNIVVIKVQNQPVMQLDFQDAPFEKSLFGQFGRFNKGTMTLMQSNVPIPSLLLDDRVLSLIMAAELAPGNLGPAAVAVIDLLTLFCCCCCCFAMCCRGSDKSTDETMKPGRSEVIRSEEQKPLVMGPGEAGKKEAAAQAAAQNKGVVGYFLGCCSRRAAPPQHGMHPV